MIRSSSARRWRPTCSTGPAAPPCSPTCAVPTCAVPTDDCGPVTVYLVGAGPGDPGLLTVRGAELLARADIVVYDRLSEDSLLELAPPSAERRYMGKEP